MTVTALKEGVLNDDELFTPDDGKVFKGGYVGWLEYYTYANEWGNQKHVKRFKNVKTMRHYINKHYNGATV